MKKWMLCLFWVVMILFTIVSTKIVHYSSMAYLPLSFLATLYIYNTLKNPSTRKRFVEIMFLMLGIAISLAITLVPVLAKNKEILIPYISDPFAVASLNFPVHWSGFEFLIGIGYATTIVITFFMFKKNRALIGTTFMGVSTSTCLLLTLYFIAPKIEAHSQRPAIEFYEQIAKEDCYVDTYGFKSYAQYFYFEQGMTGNENRKNKDWLVTGNIDKTTYFVSKITNKELQEYDDVVLLNTVGGFSFYKRETNH